MKNQLVGIAVGLAVLFCPATFAGSGASDYAREKKWADEILPGLVVGDPVYLQTPRGHHKFLTLFTPAVDTLQGSCGGPRHGHPS